MLRGLKVTVSSLQGFGDEQDIVGHRHRSIFDVKKKEDYDASMLYV